MVVIDPLEASQEHFAFVDRWIETLISINVRVDDEVGRLRDDDFVVDDRDAQRRNQRRFLDERLGLVRLAIPIGVLEHDDAIAFGLAGMMRAIANAFRHPDAAVTIDIDVGRVVKERRCRPERDFKPVWHLEEIERDLGWLRGRCLRRLRWWRRGRLTTLHRGRAEGLLWHDDGQHQDEHHLQPRESLSAHMCLPLRDPF